MMRADHRERDEASRATDKQGDQRCPLVDLPETINLSIRNALI
jgi:hypothetical protein